MVAVADCRRAAAAGKGHKEIMAKRKGQERRRAVEKASREKAGKERVKKAKAAEKEKAKGEKGAARTAAKVDQPAEAAVETPILPGGDQPEETTNGQTAKKIEPPVDQP